MIGAALVLPPAAWLIWQFLASESEPQPARKIAQITLVRPPPPPPPPPPKPPEKPPEPPRIKEEVKVEPPKPVEQPKTEEAPKEAAPPPGPLGVDGAATGSGDGFGLAAREGGRDITLGPANTGGSARQGLNHALFANGVARHIAQELARLGPLRGYEFRVELRVWMGRDGRIERAEIARGSGDAELDRLLEDGLARIAALRQPLPEGMTQPLRIRVTSADA